MNIKNLGLWLLAGWMILGKTWAGYSGGVQHGARVFLTDTANKVVVYDLEEREVIRTIGTTVRPRMIRANESGMYLAQGDTVLRYTLDGVADGTFHVADGHILEMDLGNDALLVGTASTHTWLRLTDGTVQTQWPTSGMRETVMSADGDHLFFEVTGDGFGKRERLADHTAGPVETTTASTHFSIYDQLRLIASGQKILTGNGQVYHAADLSYAGGLGDAGRMVESGDTVYTWTLEAGIRKFDANLLERARMVPDHYPVFMAVHETDLVLFYIQVGLPESLGTEWIPLSSIENTLPPSEDPFGRLYTPSDIEHVGNFTVLLDAENRQLHRYNWTTRQSVPGMPVVAPPIRLEALGATGFALYEGGRISRLNIANGTEVSRGQLANEGVSFLAAGDRLLVVDKKEYRDNVAWHSFDPNGVKTGTALIEDPLEDLTYVPVRNEVLGRQRGKLYRQPLDADGLPSGASIRPAASLEYAWNGIRRVHPDGDRFVTGEGRVHSTETFELLEQYPRGFWEMGWAGDVLFSLEERDGETRVCRWDSATAFSQETLLEGQPLSLSLTDSEVRVVTLVEGQPRFTVLSSNLDLVHQSILNRKPDRLELDNAVVPLTAVNDDPVGVLSAVHGNSGPREYTYELILDPDQLFRLEGDTLTMNLPDVWGVDPETGDSGWQQVVMDSKYRGWPDIRQVRIRATDTYGHSGEYELRIEVRPVPFVEAAPLEAAGRAFEIEQTLLDDSGNLFLVSHNPMQIFRYDTLNGTFRAGLPLYNEPHAVRYHPARDRLLLLYKDSGGFWDDFGDNVVTEVDPDADALSQEVVFYRQQSAFLDLLPMGEDVLFPHRHVYEGNRWNYFISAYDGDWNLRSRTQNGNTGTEYHVDETNRRILYNQNRIPEILRWDQLDADGAVTGASPENTDALYTGPMALNADGTVVAVADGTLYTMETLQPMDTLPVGFERACWVGGSLVTLSTPHRRPDASPGLVCAL